MTDASGLDLGNIIAIGAAIAAGGRPESDSTWIELRKDVWNSTPTKLHTA